MPSLESVYALQVTSEIVVKINAPKENLVKIVNLIVSAKMEVIVIKKQENVIV